MQTNWNVAASLRIMSALVPFISLWHATSFLFLSLSLSLFHSPICNTLKQLLHNSEFAEYYILCTPHASRFFHSIYVGRQFSATNRACNQPF